MTPRTVPIVCARAPRHIVYVPAVRREIFGGIKWALGVSESVWECSWCGARVRVVA